MRRSYRERLWTLHVDAFGHEETDPVTHARRNAAIRRKLQAYTEAHTRTKRSATAALVREGFILKNGQPAPAFADAD